MAASRLLFCLYNGITSTKRKKKTKSAVPGPSSFIQPFRQVLGVWFAGCWALSASACTHRHSVARKHSAVEFPAGLPGMKRWDHIWWDLLGFTLQTSVLGNTLLIPCVWCDNLTDKPCDIYLNPTSKWMLSSNEHDRYSVTHPVTWLSCLCVQGFPGDFGERGPPGPDGNPVSEMI